MRGLFGRVQFDLHQTDGTVVDFAEKLKSSSSRAEKGAMLAQQPVRRLDFTQAAQQVNPCDVPRV
jgi:hypothetical protein